MAPAADALLAREATTDDVPDLAALTTAADVGDAADLVALVAVAGGVVPVGRTRSTPTLLQSPTVTVLVSGEELRLQYGSRLSAGRDR